jgi:hypothetical protein
MFLLLLACRPPVTPSDSLGDADTDADADADTDADGDTDSNPLAEWDAPASTLDCNEGLDAPLYDVALADAEIAREDVGFTESLWNKLSPLVGGAFQLPFFESVHHAPEYAACFARQAAADADAAAVADHPVAAALTALAPYGGVTLDGQPLSAGGTSLKEALKILKESAGGGQDSDLANDLPTDLAEALVPIVLALAQGIDARHAMDAAAEAAGIDKTRGLYAGASGLVLWTGNYQPSITDAAYVDAFAGWYISDAGPRALIEPARQIAYAIEAADLSRFAGGDTAWSFNTDAGTLRIWPSTDDTHAPADDDVLFELDLGGNDVYLDGAGANANDDNPVSVTVDLGGQDRYGYTEEADSHDGAGMLVSDDDGRQNSGGYWISASDNNRQGAGRYGIGMLFDYGGDDDSYASLRMSQGFGALGVGVLADDGGNDSYTAEAGVQGSAVFGYGLLLDGGGDDVYTAWGYAQGFGYVGSVGALIDAGGNDVYWSDPGNSFGGVTLYASPQLPGGEGNSSFSQGAGFGLRGDSYSQWLSGGFGFLRDMSGDDNYAVGVFGQGTGYWEGAGLLSDGAGNDSYDALYYVQGGAAHYATGILHDGGGNDKYNQGFDSYYMQTGAGHDFSLGLFIDDSGDDIYGYGGLAAGASNCQGVGVFVDHDGSDIYDARSTYSTGLGNHSGECESRDNYPSIGIFLDDGGDADTYLWTEGDSRTPADDSVFGIEWNGTADEHGGAADGDGGAGF